MKPEVTIQSVTDSNMIPSEENIKQWIYSAINELSETKELTVRIVDEAESAELNQSWRNKAGPTNVLSFPYDDNGFEHSNLLGDLVICAPILEQEAKQQNKALEAHWAHIIIHGSLHLLGYDHINSTDAEIMESKEKIIMANLGYDDPYQLI